MEATKVIPAAWKEIRFLYEKDKYAAIWGKYKGKKRLGVRWSGKEDDERGYPGQGKHPLWYVEPPFLVLPILQKLLEIAIEDNDKEHIKEILFAMKEYKAKPPKK